jgi:4-amino-4-deoxy-L-arabinose transferase-like glycosyltransferase
MKRIGPWLLVGLAVLAWFGTLGWRDLITPDEGRYAELGRQMLASGDWITPRLNGILYFEKPALQYWATAVSFELFGMNAFAARLWPGLTGAFAVLALWWSARRVLGGRAAMYSACVLGSCVWWLGNSHFLSLDMGLSCFLTLALLGFWLAQRDAATPADNRLGMWVAWIAMALAVLSKGLIGIVLPGAALVAYSLVARDLGVWRRMRWGSGPLLFALVAAPWFVAVSARNPDFAHFFFIHEHVERFLTTTHRRPGPWWYFFPILAIGLVPWITLLPGALALGWRRMPGRFQGNRLLLVWAVVIFAFFSVSSSKLSSYILPVFPALALLIGQHIQRLPARRLGWHFAAMIALAAGLAAVLAALTRGWAGTGTRFSPAELDYRDWIMTGLAVIAMFAALGTSLARAGRVGAAVTALSFAGLFGTQLILQGHQTLATEKSSRHLAARIAERMVPDAPVFSVSYYDQTLPFYLGRPVTLVNWVDEFETGLRIEPRLGLPSEEVFAAIWRQLRQGAAVMRPETHQQWREAGLPMIEVYRDPSRVAVIRAER